jgi:hypothetical protein
LSASRFNGFSVSMDARNEREANEAALPLLCPSPLAKPRRTLAAAEWVWCEKRAFPKSNQELFAAQFVLGEDPRGPAGMNDAISQSGKARDESKAAAPQGNAAQGVEQREIIKPDSAFQTRLRSWLLSE